MAEELKAFVSDALTGLVIERALTQEEIAERLIILADIESGNALIQAKEEARTSALAKLAALGLTEEEIAAL
jgi:hypothetical protein